MKRIISIITLIALVCLAFTACGGDTTTTPEDNTVYGKLTRSMASRDFDTLSITVITTAKDGTVLESEYVYSTVDEGLRIEYSAQKIEQFDISDGECVAPSDMISTVEGTVVVSEGKIILMTGQDAPVDLSGADYPEFKFKESFFSDVESMDGEFSASVLSPTAFVGFPLTCSAMTVHIYYNVFRITDILLTYTTAEGTSVSVNYEYR